MQSAFVIAREDIKMELKQWLRVATKNGVFFVDEMAELEEGQLIKFFLDGNLLLAVPHDDFLFTEKVTR